MNIMKPQPNKSRAERRYQRREFCSFFLTAGLLMLLVCIASLTLSAEDTETEVDTLVPNGAETQITENSTEKTEAVKDTDGTTANSGGNPTEMPKEKITGTADKMERYDQDGITILIGNAKTVRYNEEDVEIGFLNADKITLKADPETGTTTEIIAEGNVEIRDQDIFATCDHAIMNNLTNIITLKENVVVLQDKDRLETKLFTFNRTTGKQTGEGGVKFKVTVTQAAPVSPDADENTENGEDTGGEETSAAAPEKAGAETQGEVDAETSDAESTAEEKPETDAGNADDADSEEETQTDTGNGDGTDTNAETEESENN